MQGKRSTMTSTFGALSIAVALGVAATATSPATAQSLFTPSGPVIGSPLGGGVLNNIGFGAGANTGFGSFNTSFNSRFILPMNANFNSQLASFNTQRGFNTNLLDYNARLAQFNTDRTNTANQFSQFNSALNVPSANFSTPNPQLFPSTANLISSNGTLINPSINPLAVNNSSSLGFNAFNTFNPVTARVVNFGSAGVPPIAQVQNLRTTTTTQPATTVSPAVMSGFPRPGQVTTYGPYFANPRLDASTGMQILQSTGPQILQMNQTRAVGSFPQPGQVTTYGPYFANPRLDAMGGTQVIQPMMSTGFPQPGQVTTYGPYFANPRLDSVSFGTARTAFGTGMGSGSVVMGGRAVR